MAQENITITLVFVCLACIRIERCSRCNDSPSPCFLMGGIKNSLSYILFSHVAFHLLFSGGDILGNEKPITTLLDSKKPAYQSRDLTRQEEGSPADPNLLGVIIFLPS